MVDFVRPLFSLGQIVATPGALEALKDAGQAPTVFLQRHVIGDWVTVARKMPLPTIKLLRMAAVFLVSIIL
jgi:hypothetical protein